MRANVYFIDLTDEMVAAINAPGPNETSGWASPEGKAYMSAKAGKIDDTNKHLFKHTAVVEYDDGQANEGNEAIWMMLQNHDTPWDANENYDQLVQVVSKNNRSMDVGDVIVWEDGRAEMVDSLGFKPSTFVEA